MANMSYCQFQNTLADLRECNNWLADHEPTHELSDDEQAAFHRLIKLCAKLAEDYAQEELRMNLSDYSQIPEHMMDAIERYVKHHVPAGDFLSAVISNDLCDAVGRADDTNIEIIPVYVAWFYNEAPSSCHGSRERMEEWLRT